MIWEIIRIILIVILSIFVIYWIGRVFAKGVFDEINNKFDEINDKLMQKFNNKPKTKEDE